MRTTTPRSPGTASTAPARPLAVLLAGLLVALLPASQAGAAPGGSGTDLVRPVPGPVARHYDPPAERWQAGHRGIDLAAPPGTPVVAAAGGRVAFVGMVAGRPVVSVEHADGTRTTYEPVRARVRAGATVSAGQSLGEVVAGHDCACLHFGLRRGRDYLDPNRFGSADGQVRLHRWGARPAPPPPPPSPIGGGEVPLAGFTQPTGAHGLARPSAGPVSSRFGMRFHPVLYRWKLHDGVDFADPCGAPVRASAAGRVVLVEANLAYGNRVVVDHGVLSGRRVRTSYNHLSSVAASPGQVLGAGQRVGRVGTTGFSTGCHLHFMVWIDGGVVDPLGQL
ncbi:peptidoglycan DD-metalloendopeptidase family protein [Luteococcus peritonei]|uniref:Peptidoglycan DD-metalloendopeptidase family protein n=1 Tax=Luteococcus peritonei TaxID=88874 RepID=A0ABW4RVM5_9ACTN